MILNWDTLKEECPLAAQLIEAKSGYRYEVAYGTLLNDKRKPIEHHDIERFFDDHGWYMSHFPTEFPGWNAVISDTTGGFVFSDASTFEDCKSRNHAKSLIASIAIKLFQEKLKDMIKVPEGAMVLSYDDLHATSRDKELDTIVNSDFTSDAMGLIANSNSAVLIKGNKALIIKSNAELPQPGMILDGKK